MKLETTQELAPGRLTVKMAENCYGDSKPIIDAVHFNRFHEKISGDTAALAGAIISSRWCGDVLEFQGPKIGADFGEAIRLLVPDARFVQPIDGYRRHLCEGRLDVLSAPAAMATSVLSSERDECGLTRLVTWGGEFVEQRARNSARYVAGEISTNADVLLPDWEVSVCLGLLVGGLTLRSITVPRHDKKHARDFERIAEALRIVGVRLRVAGPVPRLRAPPERREVPALAVGSDPELAVESRA